MVNGEVFLTQRGDDGHGPTIEQNQKLEAQDFTAVSGFGPNARVAEYIDAGVQGRAKLAAQGNQLDAGNGFAGGAPLAANPTAAKSNIGPMNVSTMQAFHGSRFTCVGDWTFNVRGDEVLCTKTHDGSQVWNFKLEGDLKAEGGFLAAPPVACGGQLFVATHNGEVLQLDPKSGKVNARHKVGGPVRSQPVIEGGGIFVGTDDGKLVCLDTGNPLFTGWSMWGKDAAHSSVQESQ